MHQRLDPFALLGLPRSFELDPRALETAYLSRARELHPDRRAATRPDRLGDADAAVAAAELNDARAALADPEARANLLLELLGGPRREEDRSLPDGFLSEIMDARQALEDAVASGDPAERGRMRQWAEEQRRARMDTASRLFRLAAVGGPPDPARPALLRQIRTELNAWRYIERMIEQVADSV
jgi:molecular chaperone HscB